MRSRIARIAIASLLATVAQPGTARDTAPIHLPLTFIESMPVTTIQVGDVSVQAIVDTTAGDADGALTLSKDVIERAHGIPLGKAVMRDAQGNEFSPLRFRMPVVTIDGHVFRNVRVVQALDHARSAGPPVPNTLGKHLLSEFLVAVDYAQSSVALWPRETAAAAAGCGPTRIPMAATREARLPVSEFSIDGARLRLAWGTATNYSLLSAAAADRSKLATLTHGPGSPEFHQTEHLSAAGHDLGSLELVVLPVKLTNDFEGVLGGNFFEHHVVCLDYTRHEVRVR